MVLMRTAIVGLSLLPFIGTVLSASGPYCAVCDDDGSLADCRSFHRCQQGQRCFLQKFEHDGHSRYYGGCTSDHVCHKHDLFHDKRDFELITDHNPSPQNRGHLLCGECCDENECNLHLCGSKSSVVYCAKCNGEKSIRDCTDFTECPARECYLQVYKPTPHIFHGHSGHNLIYGGCATTDECRSINKRDESLFVHNEPLETHNSIPHTLECAGCCQNGSICNVELCGQKEFFHLPTHSTVSTDAPTTPKIHHDTASTHHPTHKVHTTATTPTTTTQATTTATTPTTTTQATTPTTTTQATTTATTPTTTIQTTTTATTPTTTTQATSTVTTTLPTTSPTPGIQLHCHQCSGPLCGVLPDTDPVICPVDSFCMNSVFIDNNGQKTIDKGCGTEAECQTKWWLETSDSSRCMAFHPLTPYNANDPFTCYYCCSESTCNSDIKPKDSTLFTGHV